jgi:hypothetical protein
MPRLNPLGGIFWRLDSNGNLTAYDPSGTTVLQVIGGILSALLNAGIQQSNTPITSTTSLSGVHSGFYFQITTRISTRVLYMANGNAFNQTAGDSCGFGFWRKAGAQNPTGGLAIDGTWLTKSGFSPFTTKNNTNAEMFSIIAIDVGLTVGQTYTYSFGFSAVTGGTAVVQGNAGTTQFIVGFEI